MADLVPKLKQRNVAPEKLVLDPNNPRFITRDDETFDESEALDRMVTTSKKIQTTDKKGKELYKIKDLENSIKQNGWWPIDFIFVKKYDEHDRYLVLEGNRRVAAIRNIRDDDSASTSLIKSLDKIDVMEIIDDSTEDQLQKQITYLLGVRHHGSLKKWTPFAQAHNIYKRYLHLAEMDPNNFEFNPTIANQVADALSINFDDVENRLKVYRAMEQLGEVSIIKNSDGGMEDRYYSVCAEILLTKDKALKKYVKQDDINFTLNEGSIERMNNLCHFDKKGRAEAPISNPQEWRKLSNILKDNDEDKKKIMLEDVEINKKKPSIVWAERAADLQTLQWDKWLNKVNSVIREVTLGDDLTSKAAKDITIRLLGIIEKLETKEKSQKGKENA
jgi:hypothetical protein